MASESASLLPAHHSDEPAGKGDAEMLAWKGWDGTEKRRLVMSVLAVLCGLASGTNYVYSAYAPQLATKLHLSSTQINLIGTAGNLGVYLTGPLWGKIVDTRGQRIPLLVGGILVLIGYAYVYSCYTLAMPIWPRPGEPEPASPLYLLFLCIAMFFTGCGGSAGLTAAVNAVAKSFSDKTRASMTGAVLAGFGLSAFAFSTAGHVFYGGDAGGLLLLLSLGTGVPLIVGSFIVRPYPPATEKGYEPLGEESEDLIDDVDVIDPISGEAYPSSRSTSLELSRSLSPAARGRHVGSASRSTSPCPSQKHTRASSVSPLHLSHSPLDLACSVDFWLLFVILSLLCGTGLMYINNAGTVALALGRDGQLEYDVKKISAWQAKQVATISVWNCLGRILGGMASDFCKTRYHIQRIWFLPIVAIGFVTSQVAAMDTVEVRHLWLVSTLLGLAYGSLFNVLPMLVLEWFGMVNFGQNWGWTAIAPVIGGNVFNLLFGRIYDSNTIGRIGAPGVDVAGEIMRSLPRSGGVSDEDAKHDCLIGAGCYATAFRVSTLGCCIAFGLSVLAGFRRERRNKIRPTESQG